MAVVITGSSGLLGSALVRALRDRGRPVVRLIRKPPAGPDEAFWDPREGVLDPAVLEGADAVVHLAGASIAGRRWNDDYRRELLGSRVDGTRLIATTIAGLSRKPGVLLSSSAMGVYGDTGEHPVDESSKPPVWARGQGGKPPRGQWLADLARAWEAETAPAEEAGVRVVWLRTGHVLTTEGGFLGPQLPLFKLGMGAPLGSGRQYTSWIALPDWVGAVEYLLADPQVSGPVNLTAPTPVTNAVFTKALGRALRRPTLPVPVPGFALRAALGDLADEGVLIGQRVLPRRLMEMGYRFRYPRLDEALAAIL
ncbi:TIGR01777 family oxidoreductase [Sphaerisporangium sp. TRM90804]|uniref:TIGR01777 family oxidoreductase n=1 Tax=Sphaerisporangium sp. TRM90804 TaxID=3031113 RepID=UPI00244AA9A7|nr:TIGR01777 family oxidoreductase [Sphaerisporangium sp. TRM90804]MDH2424593.1 TIGR01777 family oxidoreductase [Sphaerisporangium sp. TRM90804]